MADTCSIFSDLRGLLLPGVGNSTNTFSDPSHHGREPRDLRLPGDLKLPRSRGEVTQRQVVASPSHEVPHTHPASVPPQPRRTKMPYNNAAIPPPEEITGTTTLPLARVKKILLTDEDTHQVSNNASYVITIATEMFIRYLSEQALNVVKAEKKPRRNIQYKDLANAVARIDNLQFLEDVIPQTTTYREYKARRANKITKAPQSLQNGQTTLDRSRPLPERSLDAPDPQRPTTEDASMSDGTIDEQNAEVQRPWSSKANINGSGIVFEHYEPNGSSKRDESGDVEMG